MKGAETYLVGSFEKLGQDQTSTHQVFKVESRIDVGFKMDRTLTITEFSARNSF